jgi:beta-phosphoglucomutase
MKIRGCLFDMDGVIVDTAKHHYVAWKALADDLAIPFSEKENDSLKGFTRLDSLECILRLGNLEVSSTTKIELMEKKNQLYLDITGSMSEDDILPGVKELVLELKEEGIGICLGSSSKNATKILKNIGLFDLFDGVVDGNHLTLSKPDPEVFLKGAKILGLSPATCIVFEDAQSGIDAAISGGFFAVGLGEAGTLQRANANVKDLAQMNLETLKNLVNRYESN